MNLIGIVLIAFSIVKCLTLVTGAHTMFANRLAVPEGRIVGGYSATPHSHPYIVSLQMRFLWVRAHFCGGSLLNKNWVLTAGHCITESWLIKLLNIDAVAGAHDVDNFSPEVQIQMIVQRIEHPHYKGGIGPYDIAMLKTEMPFEYTNAVKPIALPPENTDLSKGSLMLSGWGVLRTTVFIPVMPTELQELNVTYLPYEKCNEQMDKFSEEENDVNPLDSQANVCTGPIEGGKAACNGDSGGPLTLRRTKTTDINEVNVTEDKPDNNLNVKVNNKTIINVATTEKLDEEYILVGVVSWGVTPCGEKGAPTVYTNVSKYLDFIKSYIST